MSVFDLPGVDRIVDLALDEDLGRGDMTTRLTVPVETDGRAEIVAKQDAVFAGGPVVAKVYERVACGGVRVESLAAEGATLVAGDVAASLSGPIWALLSGERVALNFVQRLSGTATLTRRFVEAVAGTSARIVDTRKTSPGMRALQKHAVRAGGGRNHRFGLDDGILIKDNHIVAAGGVGVAVGLARAGAPHTVRVEVECVSREQVDEALAAGGDAILLDNMSVEQLAAEVKHIAGRATVEASGGIGLDNVRAVAETGVDIISVGALTHSAAAVDLSMKVRV